ncbi:hypothetical protein [Gordonia soli]|uniref:hypothetical protein n=1 Tax=Gordonia soli TaxID=320799 RepID=UPI000348CE50|nr:hypothetical protein [Gordonia soli]
MTTLQRIGVIVVDQRSPDGVLRLNRGHPELESLADLLYIHQGASLRKQVPSDVAEVALFDLDPYTPAAWVDGGVDPLDWFPPRLRTDRAVSVLAGEVDSGLTVTDARRLVVALGALPSGAAIELYRSVRRIAPLGLGSGPLLNLLQTLDDQSLWRHAAQVLHRSAAGAVSDTSSQIGLLATEHAYAAMELSLHRTLVVRTAVATAATELAAGRQSAAYGAPLHGLGGDGTLEAAVAVRLDDLLSQATGLLTFAYTLVPAALSDVRPGLRRPRT